MLSRAAWARIKTRLLTEPVESSGLLQIATWPTGIDAIWSTIPRFALVDLEITDPAPPPIPALASSWAAPGASSRCPPRS